MANLIRNQRITKLNLRAHGHGKSEVKYFKNIHMQSLDSIYKRAYIDDHIGNLKTIV
jgi:hypothetical protein